MEGLTCHTPSIATFMPGKIIFKDMEGNLSTIRSVNKGVFEIANNQVTIPLD